MFLLINGLIKLRKWSMLFYLLPQNQGGVIGAAARRYEAISDPYVLEALGLRDCILDCCRRELRSISFCGYVKLIIDKCVARDAANSKIGALLQ
ncbi:unnamed protein product [Linum tenue]|uniref:Uncharacterized protein n=1 Tax=Linum tenue TaxID=586396 RepID=A0AAV0I0R5_9ROSI|nr:unnamed protein product [Linum tenue]